MTRSPLEFTLCLTRRCNLRCRYCYAGEKVEKTMPREIAQQALALAQEECKRTGRGLDLFFFGGEPLLEWDLLQWCHGYMEARASCLPGPLRYGLTTNATLLTPERFSWLAEKGIHVALSVDGSPAMHNVNRVFASGQGSHAALLPALAWAAEHPEFPLHLVCVVSPNQVAYLAEGVEWLARHGQRDILLNMDYWSAWDDASCHVLREQLEMVARLVVASYRENRPVHIRNFADKIRSHLWGGRQECTQCLLGEKEIAVSVEGELFPCARLVGAPTREWVMGNTRQGIDRAKQAALIALRGNRTPACQACALRHRCMHRCGCSNWASSGSMDQVSPFLCQSERALIQVADRLAEELYKERNPAFLKEFYPGLDVAYEESFT